MNKQDKGLQEHRLDRAKLREKINLILERYSFDHDGWNVLPIVQFGEVADQILTEAERYYHPSIEAQKLQIELAKKQERERIFAAGWK